MTELSLRRGLLLCERINVLASCEGAGNDDSERQSRRHCLVPWCLCNRSADSASWWNSNISSCFVLSVMWSFIISWAEQWWYQYQKFLLFDIVIIKFGVEGVDIDKLRNNEKGEDVFYFWLLYSVFPLCSWGVGFLSLVPHWCFALPLQLQMINKQTITTLHTTQCLLQAKHTALNEQYKNSNISKFGHHMTEF